MGKIVTIKVDGEITSEDVAVIPPLEDLQARVGGGLIQLIPQWAHYDGARAIVLCNEEGKLRGMKANHAATQMWWLACPSARHVDSLVGDIVILTGSDAFLDRF